MEGASSKIQKLEFQQREDIRKLLSMPEGRRLLLRLLRHCKTFESVFEPNSRIAYNSGMQDVGHFIYGEIIKAQPDALIAMVLEAQEMENG